MHKHQKGFTLAEVLITLLIIGIVASLVIPALINDTQEAEYNVGVKKAQAELSNALKMVLINNGGSINVGNGSTLADHMALTNEFCNVMTCAKKDIAANIFGIKTYRGYKGGDINWPASGDTNTPSIILNDGCLVRFYSQSGCNNWGVNSCGFIDIDINGKKGPNMFGKDFYFFYITRQNGDGTYRILPSGTQGDTVYGLPNGCTAGSTSGGTSNGCTAKRLTDPEHMP